MATAKPLPSGQPRRRRRKLLLGALVLLAAVLAAFWPRINGYAVAGASLGAREACSCRYVGGRTLSDCRKDFEPGMWPVLLREDEQARAVTALVPLLSSQTATYRQGEGCLLEPWKD
jgi:hypothetical protein